MPRAPRGDVRQQRARSWGPLTVFTEWERVSHRLRAVRPSAANALRYLVFQPEVCPDTGRTHLQLFIQFTRAVRGSHVHSFVCPSPEFADNCRTFHLEVSRDAESARNYCRKEETRLQGAEAYETGEFATQGKRTDISQVCELVQSGATIREAFELHPSTMVRHYKGIIAYRNITARNRERAPEVRIYWGDTGTGKSRRAFFEARHHRGTAGHCSPYFASLPAERARGASGWWDDYEPGEPVVINEYQGQWDLSTFKQLLDRYPMRVAVKGSFVPFNSDLIILTSNKNPEDWYPEASQADRDALRRRYSVVEHFSTLSPPWTEPWLCMHCPRDE